MVMFGGLIAFAVYRIFYPGLVWVEHDMETVIFHCSRKEGFWFRWEEMSPFYIGGSLFLCRTGGRKDRDAVLVLEWAGPGTDGRKRKGNAGDGPV